MRYKSVVEMVRDLSGDAFHPSDWFVRDDTPGDEGDVMWVYRRTTDGSRWRVGYWNPKGEWFEDSIYEDRDEAAQRVHWLNGGNNS